MKNLVRLLPFNHLIDYSNDKLHLSPLTRLQETILLGPFTVRGLLPSLQRLAMACNRVTVHVPDLLGCPELKLVSLAGISTKEEVAAPPGCLASMAERRIEGEES